MGGGGGLLEYTVTYGIIQKVRSRGGGQLKVNTPYKIVSLQKMNKGWGGGGGIWIYRAGRALLDDP